MTVWIVTVSNPSEEPIVTAFSNEEAAQKCYSYFKEYGLFNTVCLDKCKVFDHFEIR